MYKVSYLVSYYFLLKNKTIYREGHMVSDLDCLATFAMLICKYCLILIGPSIIWQAVEQPKT